MRTKLLIISCLILCCESLAGSAVNPNPNESYISDLTRDEIARSTSWSPSEPLPLSFAEAVSAARSKLGTLTDDAKKWFVYKITLWQPLMLPDRHWCYGITLCIPTKIQKVERSYAVSGHANFEVTMNGKVGKLRKVRNVVPPEDRRESVAELPFENSWLFGNNHTTTVPRKDVLKDPDWNPSLPLPISIDKAMALARKELAQQVKNAAAWEITSIELQALPDRRQKWFFVLSFHLPTPSDSGGSTSFVLLVTFDGKVGPVTP